MSALIDQTCVRAAPLYNNIVIVLSTVTVLEIRSRTILEIIFPRVETIISNTVTVERTIIRLWYKGATGIFCHSTSSFLSNLPIKSINSS